jgi:hypothetical protein
VPHSREEKMKIKKLKNTKKCRTCNAGVDKQGKLCKKCIARGVDDWTLAKYFKF